MNSAEETQKPVNPVFVLRNGTRVRVELRDGGVRRLGRDRPNEYWRVWEPVIEGDVLKLMPMIDSLDADEWPGTAALLFPTLPGDEANEWAQRIIDNSPILARTFAHGREFRRRG